MGVERRQMLVAVHRIAGIVDVEGCGRWRAREGVVEEIDPCRRYARHVKPRGRVLQTAHGRLRGQRAAALRRPADGQLEQGIGTQGVAVVGILPRVRLRPARGQAPLQAIANMRKRSIAGSVCTTSAGSRPSRIQPASVSARPSPRSASRNRTRPPSDETSPPSKPAVTFLHRTAGIWGG